MHESWRNLSKSIESHKYIERRQLPANTKGVVSLLNCR